MDLGQYEKCADWYIRMNPDSSKKKAVQKIKFRQKFLHKFELPYIEMFITTKCNLRCKYCSNLIPYCHSQKNFDVISVKETLSKLLSNVDRIYRLKLHGGEVMLHPELIEIIKFAGKQKKIFSLSITTNGTIIPNEELLKTINEAKCIVQISEYNLKNSKIPQLIDLLKKYEIPYRHLSELAWRDMGNFDLREKNMRAYCSISRCVSLYDKKIFICSRAAMMREQSIANSKFVEIFQSRKQFQKSIIAYYNDMTINACNYCNGDTPYAIRISPGEQVEE